MEAPAYAQVTAPGDIVLGWALLLTADRLATQQARLACWPPNRPQHALFQCQAISAAGGNITLISNQGHSAAQVPTAESNMSWDVAELLHL